MRISMMAAAAAASVVLVVASVGTGCGGGKGSGAGGASSTNAMTGIGGSGGASTSTGSATTGSGSGGMATGTASSTGSGPCVPKTCLTLAVGIVGQAKDQTACDITTSPCWSACKDNLCQSAAMSQDCLNCITSQMMPDACGVLSDGCGNLIDCGGCDNPHRSCAGDVPSQNGEFTTSVMNLCGGGCTPLQNANVSLCVNKYGPNPNGSWSIVACTTEVAPGAAPSTQYQFCDQLLSSADPNSNRASLWCCGPWTN